MIEPLQLSYDIACPAAHAFDVWTTRMSAWWPKGHSSSGDSETVVVLEPRDGGRIYERTSDGREIDWGRVTRWEPPAHLGYTWHIGRDSAQATNVELRFIALDDDTTRLEITHTGWENLGEDGRTYREANTSGWNSLIPHFAEAARS